MTSPPNSATSPPGPTSLALPKQRPTLALPNGATKSRKPSIASASSAHPLRQTSFPPQDTLDAQRAAAQYSPTDGGFEDDFSDSEIVSAVSGPAGAAGPSDNGVGGKKRKRGTGKMGRPKKKRGSESVINGEDGKSRGAKSTTGGAGQQEADDEDDADNDDETDARGGRVPAYEGAQMTEAEIHQDNSTRTMFEHYMKSLDAAPLTNRRGITRRDFEARYQQSKAVKLRGADVKKLVNQTVSQSVPPPVVLAVQAYTKLFAGMLVEGAREVQREWMAVEERRADGEENVAYKRVKRSYEESRQEDDEEAEEGMENGEKERRASGAPTPNGTAIKPEPTSPATTQPNSSNTTTGRPSTQDPANDDLPPLHTGGAAALATSIDECDRGPLLPDHLRESLRRYKKAHRGGGVGFTGYSLEGKAGAAARMGGRRLFR